MVENNEANRAKLAEAVVERADMAETIEMAICGCVDLYEKDEGKFQEDWEATFGE